MLRNRVLAAAYAGAHRFGVEVFDPSTSNTLMAALLVHDLRVRGGRGATRRRRCGTRWSCSGRARTTAACGATPFEPRSVLGIAVALGMLQRGA